MVGAHIVSTNQDGRLPVVSIVPPVHRARAGQKILAVDAVQGLMDMDLGFIVQGMQVTAIQCITTPTTTTTFNIRLDWIVSTSWSCQQATTSDYVSTTLQQRAVATSCKSALFNFVEIDFMLFDIKVRELGRLLWPEFQCGGLQWHYPQHPGWYLH